MLSITGEGSQALLRKSTVVTVAAVAEKRWQPDHFSSTFLTMSKYLTTKKNILLVL